MQERKKRKEGGQRKERKLRSGKGRREGGRYLNQSMKESRRKEAGQRKERKE